jgi:hypothetical protein
MSFRRKTWLVVPVLIGMALIMGRHQEWSIHKPPHGFAVVREHVMLAPHNVPPIDSKLDFTIVEVDGAQVTRETPPRFADIQPGALVSAGAHHFKARVAPHLRPAGYQPQEVSFVATVESGKVYCLVDDKDGKPVLIEENHGDR